MHWSCLVRQLPIVGVVGGGGGDPEAEVDRPINYQVISLWVPVLGAVGRACQETTSETRRLTL